MSVKLTYTEPKGKTVKLLNRNLTSILRTGFVLCKDVLLPEHFQVFGDRIREMDIRSDDIWVCSFPKTGTTWTQEMVWCIAHDADLKTAEILQTERFPFLESSSLFDYKNEVNEVKNPEDLIPAYILDSVAYIEKLPSPRFIKSHLPFKLLPEKLQRNEMGAKIIYVSRNVKDTCVSFFHHELLLDGCGGNLEEFCELFMEGNVPYGPFFEHVFEFWNRRDDPNTLVLRYEDMKKNLKSVIHRTCDFLGKTLDEEKVRKLLDHLSFEKMKKKPAVNFEGIIQLTKKYFHSEDGSFMRSGKIGTWKEEMKPEIIRRFEEWEKENLKNRSQFANFLATTH